MRAILQPRLHSRSRAGAAWDGSAVSGRLTGPSGRLIPWGLRHERRGLDSRPFLDAYDERFAQPEPSSVPRHRRRRPTRAPSRALVVAALGAAAAGLFLALGSGASHRGRPVALSPPLRKVARKQPPAQVAAAPASRQRP